MSFVLCIAFILVLGGSVKTNELPVLNLSRGLPAGKTLLKIATVASHFFEARGRAPPLIKQIKVYALCRLVFHFLL